MLIDKKCIYSIRHTQYQLQNSKLNIARYNEIKAVTGVFHGNYATYPHINADDCTYVEINYPINVKACFVGLGCRMQYV